MERALWIAAPAFVLAVVLLGAVVAQRAPFGLDRAAGAALRGRSARVALVFTRLGRWPALVVLGTLAFGIAMTLGWGLYAVVFVLAAQALSQSAAALLKRAYRRARPTAWLHVKEGDLSYPSGHATSAVVFFLGFALLVWLSPLPRLIAAPLTGALLICALAVPWSRLSLAAHYATDVIGGLLFGAAFLCVAYALIGRFAPAALP